MIIGLVGFIGSGKGTIADILTKKHNFTKLSFADTVIQMRAAHSVNRRTSGGLPVLVMNSLLVLLYR
jgi:dephospho-CoA kinase